MNLARGLLLTIEGGDGAGKGAVVETLTSALTARGVAFVATREPGGTPEANAIRALLVNKDALDWTPSAELLLFMTARAQHVRQVILPALAAKQVVVCDRFDGSTLAYQGALGIDRSTIETLHAIASEHVVVDGTILLDVPPEIGLARSRKRLVEQGSDETKFESRALAYHQAIRDSFLEQARRAPDRWTVIDATQPLAQVQSAATAVLSGWLQRFAGG
jgi:dTMP kinase